LGFLHPNHPQAFIVNEDGSFESSAAVIVEDDKPIKLEILGEGRAGLFDLLDSCHDK
jgi:hypothetical protein